MNPPKLKGFSTRSPLTYDSLDHEKRQIRLVTLHPGCWRARIRCSLATVSLDDKPNYDALSYVWGDPKATVPIFVNGNVLHATVNLWRALRRLRENSPRTIWIDAICINQSDNDEKSFQVSLMKDVFSECRNGILWLGEDLSTKKTKARPQPASKCTRRAIKLLKIITEGNHLTEQDWFCALNRDVLDSDEVELYHGHCLALKGLLDSEWWQRVWTIQEASLPQQVYFLVASHRLSFELITNAYRWTEHHTMTCCRDLCLQLNDHNYSKGAFQMLQSFTHIYGTLRARKLHHTNKQQSLQNLCRSTGCLRATIPQDKIYSLLGLVTNWKSASPLLPDYSCPVTEILTNAFLKMVEQDQDLSAFNGKRSTKRRVPIPTWIPDIFTLSSTRIEYPQEWYALTKFWASSTHFHMPILLDASTIQVKAIRFGTVDDIGGSMIGRDTIVATLANWRKLVGIEDSVHRKVPTDFTRVKLFWNEMLKAIMTRPRLRSHFGCEFSNIPWEDLEDIYQQDYARWTGTTEHRGHFRSTPWIGAIRAPPYNKIFTTGQRRFGYARRETCPGDEVYLLVGGRAPFILRKRISVYRAPGSIRCLKAYSVISEAYVSEAMDGELLQDGWEDIAEDIALV